MNSTQGLQGMKYILKVFFWNLIIRGKIVLYQSRSWGLFLIFGYSNPKYSFWPKFVKSSIFQINAKKLFYLYMDTINVARITILQSCVRGAVSQILAKFSHLELATK